MKMPQKAIDRLIGRMKEEGKNWTRIQELHENYRILKEQMVSGEYKQRDYKAFFSEYDKAFMDLTRYMQAMTDVGYITKDFYYRILEEV